MARVTIIDVATGIQTAAVAIGSVVAGPVWVTALAGVAAGVHGVIWKITDNRNTPDVNELKDEVADLLEALSQIEQRSETKASPVALEACSRTRVSLQGLLEILKGDLKRADRRDVENALRKLGESLKKLGIEHINIP